jgi:hypothetical protein
MPAAAHAAKAKPRPLEPHGHASKTVLARPSMTASGHQVFFTKRFACDILYPGLGIDPLQPASSEGILQASTRPLTLQASKRFQPAEETPSWYPYNHFDAR